MNINSGLAQAANVGSLMIFSFIFKHAHRKVALSFGLKNSQSALYFHQLNYGHLFNKIILRITALLN